jgi:4-hydroxy-tetrahydrodipicolinate synthase
VEVVVYRHPTLIGGPTGRLWNSVLNQDGTINKGETSVDAGQLKGLIVPLVTPFDRDEQVDGSRLSELVEFMLAEDPDYLMATALSGEGPLLNIAETLLIWEEVLAAAAGRVGIIPTIITTRTKTAIRLAKAAHAMGVPALMIAPVVPELYAGRSESDVFQFYADVAAATPLPLILFNYPSLTGIDLTPSFVAKLATIKNISYIKESTGDTRRVHAIQRLCGPGFKVICGNPDAALESLALGCDTWITGIMNVAPGPAKKMMDAVLLHGDFARARAIYFDQLLPIVDIIAASSNPMGTIKAGLRARGLDMGLPRKPGTDLAVEHQSDLKKYIKHINAIESPHTLTV